MSGSGTGSTEPVIFWDSREADTESMGTAEALRAATLPSTMIALTVRPRGDAILANEKALFVLVTAAHVAKVDQRVILLKNKYRTQIITVVIEIVGRRSKQTNKQSKVTKEDENKDSTDFNTYQEERSRRIESILHAYLLCRFGRLGELCLAQQAIHTRNLSVRRASSEVKRDIKFHVKIKRVSRLLNQKWRYLRVNTETIKSTYQKGVDYNERLGQSNHLPRSGVSLLATLQRAHETLPICVLLPISAFESTAFLTIVTAVAVTVTGAVYTDFITHFLVLER